MMKYSSSRIQQESRILNVKTIIKMVESGRLNPSPTFGSLPTLSIVNRSLIIESLILGIPLETIWAEQDALGKAQLLSGFDIVSSICSFAYCEFALHGLKILKHLDRLRFDEIDYVERRHFEQMELNFNSIDYDSNPLLKCMLVEKINKDKHASNSAQLARNIIFPESALTAIEFATHCVHRHDYKDHSPEKNRKRTILRMQADILYGLLLVYVTNNNDKINYGIGLESYSYSRSHSLEHLNEININLDDDLDYAAIKLTMMIETRNVKAERSLRNLRRLINSIFDTEVIPAHTIGQNFRNKRIIYGQSSPSLLDHIVYYVTSSVSSLQLNRTMSVNELLESIDNDQSSLS